MKNTFTIDVEDGISIAMRDSFGKHVNQTDRVVHNTRYILDLLNEKEIKATFFCLGKVAKKFPYLIKEIADSNHELAVHGYSHTQYFKLTKQEIFNEVSESKKIIEDITGQQVFGHRAPAFSINEKNNWVLDELIKAGFTYDSSIVPCPTRRYGWTNFPKNICNVVTKTSQSIIEIPISTGKLINKNIPVCGGGYLRIMPYSLTNYYFKKISKKNPVIVYMHPYEIDLERYPEFFYNELRKVSFIKNLKIKLNWVGRDLFRKKISTLLDNYDFTTMIDVIQENKFPNYNI